MSLITVRENLRKFQYPNGGKGYLDMETPYFWGPNIYSRLSYNFEFLHLAFKDDKYFIFVVQLKAKLLLT